MRWILTYHSVLMFFIKFYEIIGDLEHILEIAWKIVWLWKQKFLHYTSHTTVHSRLYKTKLDIVLPAEVCSLNRNKKACAFTDGWLHQPVMQFLCTTAIKPLCTLCAADSPKPEPNETGAREVNTQQHRIATKP